MEGSAAQSESAPQVEGPLNTKRYNNLWEEIKKSSPDTPKSKLLQTLYATWHKVINDEEKYQAEIKRLRIEAAKHEKRSPKIIFFFYVGPSAKQAGKHSNLPGPSVNTANTSNKSQGAVSSATQNNVPQERTKTSSSSSASTPPEPSTSMKKLTPTPAQDKLTAEIDILKEQVCLQ